jgi:hypothetical protein
VCAFACVRVCALEFGRRLRCVCAGGGWGRNKSGVEVSSSRTPPTNWEGDEDGVKGL